MKQLVLSILCVFAIQGAFAQYLIKGKVLDKETAKAVIGASVYLSNEASQGVVTNLDGTFQLRVSEQNVELIVSSIGYETQTISISLSKTNDGEWSEVYQEIELVPNVTALQPFIKYPDIKLDESQIKTAVTLDAADLQKINTGQDIPVLLNSTPSLIYTSDAGNGMGYTQFRIRGMDLTRINVTINGVPINDQESHGVWWVNMPDLASSINSIQVQRGVGSSSNGGQAFGSSVNIETKNIGLQPSARLATSYGSFNSYKATAEFSTGILSNNWGFSGRLSKAYSDGYIDRAFSDLKSYYFTAQHLTAKSSLRLTAFSGKEKTYQAWNGVAEEDLVNNRTSNVYTYENQTDNYQQDHYQLHYSRHLGNLTANGGLHYTLGRGYYESLREGEDLADYGLNPIPVNDSTFINTTDLVRQRWLYNHFIGAIYSLEYEPGTKTKISFGGNYNQYFGDHYGEVIWARDASNSELNQRYYENDAFKRNFSNYLKINRSIGAINVQAEAQLRSVHYEFSGIGDDLAPLDHSVDFLFFNPKLMASYPVATMSKVYAYYGRSNREPLRGDFVEVEPKDWPEHESVNDFELGFTTQKGKLALELNLYYMQFKNQLVQNGQVNDVGAYLRVNVPNSYRRGIELSYNAAISEQVSWNGNINLSQNKIAEFTNYVEQYDENFEWLGQNTEVHENTTISFSPSTIIFSSFNFNVSKGLDISLQTKYVGEQFLDNTESELRKIDAYLVNDVIFNYSLGKSRYFKDLRLQAMAYNIMNELYETAGWTWMYDFDGTRSQDNAYYPQAGRSFMVGFVAEF